MQKYIDLGVVGKSKYGKRSPSKKKLIGFMILILFVFGAVGIKKLGLSTLLTPISVFSQILNPSGLSSTEGRTNILVLGLDKRLPPSLEKGILTDTIIVASLNPKEKSALLISLPRDLWVKIGGKTFGKINSAYGMGGIALSLETVENVLGIPLHYFVVLDFEGFKTAIGILGGITVDVERAFDDYYFPIAGKENDMCGLEEEEVEKEEEVEGEIEEEEDLAEKEKEQFRYFCRYEHLHFDKGLQVMDGETALNFARSRHAKGYEGTDFARAQRQQKIILAVYRKALSLETFSNPGKIKELYETYKNAVEANIGVLEAERLYQIGSKIKEEKIKMIVLNGDLLYSPQDRALYDWAYVLLPKAGDFSQVHAYIQKLLFGE